ncbi:vegetative cell wall protein gp1-like [Tupaia chinensis]|uniref:vegetative cell wall protein gp1-like n=1 Tax=Tupaia chinensis TaxID=246437 RepID=UPI0003C905A1|nr:vegetative cell wall protein gp1-like [Tupaia chinensis]
MSCSVTSEDLDQEKRAAFQRILSALTGEAEASGTCSSSQPSSLGSPPAGPRAPSLSAQLEGGQKGQDSQGPVSLLGVSAGAPSVHPGSGGQLSSPGQICSSSGFLPGYPPHSLRPVPSSVLAPAPSPLSGRDGGGLFPGVPAPCPTPGMGGPTQSPTHTSTRTVSMGALPHFLQKPMWGPPGSGEDRGPGLPGTSGTTVSGASSTSVTVSKSLRRKRTASRRVPPPVSQSQGFPVPTPSVPPPAFPSQGLPVRLPVPTPSVSPPAFPSQGLPVPTLSIPSPSTASDFVGTPATPSPATNTQSSPRPGTQLLAAEAQLHPLKKPTLNPFILSGGPSPIASKAALQGLQTKDKADYHYHSFYDSHLKEMWA